MGFKRDHILRTVHISSHSKFIKTARDDDKKETILMDPGIRIFTLMLY